MKASSNKFMCITTNSTNKFNLVLYRCFLFLFLLVVFFIHWHVVFAADPFSTLPDTGSNALNVPIGLQDQSIQYLQQLFGTVGTALSYPTASVLGRLFFVFNQGLFAFAVGYLAYQTAATTFSSSSGAQPLSERMNFYVYFRLGAGLALILPKIGGYSLVQVFFMTIILQGVHLADKIWYEAINYIHQSGDKGIYTSASATEHNVIADLTYLKKMISTASGVSNFSALMQSTSCLSAVEFAQKNIIRNGSSSVAQKNQAQLIVGSLGMGYFKDANCKKPDDNLKNNTYLCFGSTMSLSATASNNSGYCGVFHWKSGKMLSGTQSFLTTLYGQIKPMFDGIYSTYNTINLGTPYLGITSASNYLSACSSQTQSGVQAEKKSVLRSICNNYIREFSYIYVPYYYQLKVLLQINARVKSPGKTTAAPSIPVWEKDAVTYGWVNAASFVKQLTGGVDGSGSTSTSSDFTQLLKNDLEEINTFLPSVVTGHIQDVRKVPLKDDLTTDAIAALGAVNGFFTSSTSSILSGVGNYMGNLVKTPEKSSSGQTITEYDEITHSVLDVLVGKVSAGSRGGDGLFTNLTNGIGDMPNSMVTGRNTLTQNLVAMLQKVTTALTGVNFSSCNSACLEDDYSGCLDDAVQKGCITAGVGLLGSDASYAFYGEHINPLSWLSHLGLVMMQSASDYMVTSLGDLYTILTKWSITYVYFIVGSSVLAFVSIASQIAAAAQFFVKWCFMVDMYVLTLYTPFGTILAGYLYTVGIMLGVYVPFIPVILYLFSILGWFFLVIESMIAGPIVAIGMAHPEGQDFLGKAEMSLMILFSVFIRPAATILGFITSLSLLGVIVRYLSRGYSFVLLNMYLSTDLFQKSLGMIKVLILIGSFFMYVWVLLAVCEQCFSLIYLVPDRVMKWIGVQPDDTSSGKQALKSAQSGVSKLGQSISASGGRTVSATGQTLGGNVTAVGGWSKSEETDAAMRGG